MADRQEREGSAIPDPPAPTSPSTWDVLRKRAREVGWRTHPDGRFERAVPDPDRLERR